MSRVRYESFDDLQNEEAVARSIADRFDLQMAKAGPHDHFDFRLYAEGRRTTLVEIKCRNNPMAQYPTLMISAKKIIGLVEMAAREAANALLVVKWEDQPPMGITLYDPAQGGTERLNRKFHGLWFGGREDRGDPLDQELTFHFKTYDFARLCSD